MKLGSAFQKINFLRDLKADFKVMGRSYFPGIDVSTFTEESKRAIEADIDKDFKEAYIGIKELPSIAPLRSVYSLCLLLRTFQKDSIYPIIYYFNGTN